MELNRLDITLLTKDQLAGYDEIAGMYGRGKEARKIPLDKINIRNGFNHRMNFGVIRDLADFLLAGGEVPPIVVDVLKDGRAVLIEGERRVRAHKLLVDEGNEQFNILHAFINPRNCSEQERVIKSIASNNGKNFEPLELSEAFQDLRTVYGMSNADIARATGHNVMHVSNQLRLAGITDEEKDLIKEGAVSATAVLDMLKSGIAPGARLDAVKEAGNKGDGKGKLKIKDVEVMGDLKPHEAKDSDTIESLLKEVFIHIKALDRLIGTDSKMSDITFKIDTALRTLKKLAADKYIRMQTQDEIDTLRIAEQNTNGLNEDGTDTLLMEAARLIITEKQGSTFLIQRKLQIGYTRANRIMDQLEKAGIVATVAGSASREILINSIEKLNDVLLKKLIKKLSNETDDDQPF